MPSSKVDSLSSTGKFNEIALLFLPIFLITFSKYALLLVEKLFLAQLSTSAMEVAVNTAYIMQIFQLPCLGLVMLGQVFVGKWYGAGEWKLIGPGIWQFIWFSLFSFFITCPLSLIYGKYYFAGSDLEKIATPYLYFIATSIFLFPLEASLCCFFVGQKKTRFVLSTTLISQVLRLALAYLLIFGYKGWIPSLGLMGSALSTILSQVGTCFVLFSSFLKSKHHALYRTWDWHFRSKLFWECIRPGLLRGCNRLLLTICWASIAHLMSNREGDYLLVLSVGGALFLFFSFLGDSLCQAQTTVVANILGEGNYTLLERAFRSGALLAFIAIGFCAIPLILFSSQTFHYLFPGAVLGAGMIHTVFFGVWVSVAFATLNYLPLGFILAYKDVKFLFFMGLIGWINGYLLMYIAIEMFEIKASQFWLVLSLMHASSTLFFYWRMKWLNRTKAYAIQIGN